MKAVDQNAIIERIPEVAEGLKVEAWLRASVLLSLLSMRFLPQNGAAYLKALRSLDEATKERFIAALIAAYSRSSSQSDFMGVVGIPAFLGIIAAYTMFDTPPIVLLIYLFILTFYLLLYMYYRLMKAAIQALLDSSKLM